MIYHIVVGDEAATPLKEAIINEPSIAGEVMVLKDILNVGPIQKEEGTSFSGLRSAFWQGVINNDKNPVQVDDMERLLELSGAMFKDENLKAWFWMAPLPADVCAYYWLLPYLSKHKGRFYIANTAGLPFLDEPGKVFYPKSIGHILPKELIKARKLARPVTPSEIETDIDEWKRLAQEDTGIRALEGGKRITPKPDTFYDDILLSFCSQQFQKASRIVTQGISKYDIPTGDTYLGWRLKQMAAAGKILLQGDTNKTLRDYDIKLPAQEMQPETANPQQTNA